MWDANGDTHVGWARGVGVLLNVRGVGALGWVS